MGWFKRLCLFVYGLAGILALVALALPWVGPYTEQASSLIYVPEYFRALEVVVGITGVGCLVCLLRALFTPRNYKNIIIASDSGDQITVTRSAIASQAQHIVERDGTCEAGTVRVHAKKRGSIRVFVRVTPRHPLDVVEKGRELQRELDEGLAKIAADKIKSVNLEFTDPQEMDDDSGVTVPAVVEDASYEQPYASAAPSVDASADLGSQEATSESNGITVSMSSFHREEPDDPASQEVSAPDAEEGTTVADSPAVPPEPVTEYQPTEVGADEPALEDAAPGEASGSPAPSAADDGKAVTVEGDE